MKRNNRHVQAHAMIEMSVLNHQPGSKAMYL
jgi:hypothetical protein